MARSVSVIVPSVGNADELGIALDGLLVQTYFGPLEVVVVGPNGDPGRQQAESRGVRFIDDAGSRTRADACNVALDSIESELVFFTDDDVIVPKGWVESLARWFERPEVAGVGGRTSLLQRVPPRSSRLSTSVSAAGSSPPGQTTAGEARVISRRSSSCRVSTRPTDVPSS